ncbi:MAG: zinc-dependent metalloprotease [Flavobacteriales bacterium]|nr:zinc-dependent metalloprotease [Flavobacteriales bacterium]
MRKWMYFLSFLCLFIGISQDVKAQLFGKKKAKTESTVKKDPISKYEQKIKDAEKLEGLFTLYRDSKKGKLYLEITSDQLNKEYIHFSYIENGVADAGFFRGNFRGSKVFKIQKYYDRIEFVQQNTRYYFDEESALAKSSDANINNPVLLSETIIAVGKDSTKYLLDADKIFLNEKLQQLKRAGIPGFRGFQVGKLSKTKTKYHKLKNYPQNTDIVVQYAYDNVLPKFPGSSAVADSRYVNVLVQHSLIEIPSNNFEPRYDDPRVGYFTTKGNDMTSTEALNYRDLVHRWNLVKKDPDLAVSEPVEPLVFWIENTTPLKLRPWIKDAVESWSDAFESAGFKDAVQVKIQPDTALWDAGDLRYNVLRWVSSPRPMFGGYGPSFVNPRTGQIMGADIMLEWVYITKRIKQGELFEQTGLPSEEAHSTNDHYCSASSLMQSNNLFAQSAIDALELSPESKEDLLRESIKRLVLHEVGHTLGLNHNFKGSNWLTYDEVLDKETTYEKGLCSSVMEYPAINFSLNPENQGLYYDTVPGVYDHWAIQFAYADFDEEGLNDLLSESTKHGHDFANDADDMRSVGKGMDPDAMIYDLTSDPVAYAIDRIELINKILPNILDKYRKEGRSHQEVLNSYMTLTAQYYVSLKIISRQIAGVHVSRAMVGQENESKPFSPVSYAAQKKAMQALAKYGFAPSAFEKAADLYPYLQQQRRGFNTPYGGEDPKIHERVLSIQKAVLAQLLNRNVLNRMVNTSLYGNEYELAIYFTDLNEAIFEEDKKTAVNSFRQNLQLAFVNRLIRIAESRSLHGMIRSQLHHQLNQIHDEVSTDRGIGASTNAHRDYLAYLIQRYFDK